jgi:hypothetical protein
MKITLDNVTYRQFQKFFLTKKESETEVTALYLAYHTNKSPVMMNPHENKEYVEHAEKVAKARKRTYKFPGMVLSDVAIENFTVEHNGKFEEIEGHIVPISVKLHIDYST